MNVAEQWSLYGHAFTRHVHQLLEWGYEDARACITPALEEPDIMSLIAEAIESRLSNPNTPGSFRHFTITDDTYIPTPGKQGTRRRRVDLRIQRTGKTRGMRYVFEAKRLKRPNHRLRAYLGDEGLKRFVDGTYCSDSAAASMVGYVQGDSVEYWSTQLEHAFACPNDLKCVDRLSPQKLGKLKPTWSSTHSRPGGDVIRMYHVLLDCT